MKIRKSLVPMACVLFLSIVAGALVLKMPFATTGIGATVDIRPETLNLDSIGTWITAYIELPEGYDVRDIDVSTVLLDDTIAAESEPWEIGDYDGDGVDDLMVKFDRSTAIGYIWSIIYHMGSQISDKKWEIPLTITGEVDGTPFAGSDTITAICED